MPVRFGDPGLFICGPDDVAPWERESGRPSLPAADAVPGVPRPALSAVPGRRVWLVATLCDACRKRRSYCADHDSRNWWLTVSRLGR